MPRLTLKVWLLVFLAALVLVTGGWVLIDIVWVTETEQVLAAVERGRRAAEERDAATIESLFVPGFTKGGMPVDDLIEKAFLILDRYEMRSIVVRKKHAEPVDGGYDVEAVVGLGPTPARTKNIDVRMRFTRTGDRWRISAIDIMDPTTGEPVEPVR
jgi:hypothetical protein